MKCEPKKLQFSVLQMHNFWIPPVKIDYVSIHHMRFCVAVPPESALWSIFDIF